MSNSHSQTVFAEGFYSKFADILGPYLSDVGIPEDVLTDPSFIITVPQFCEVMEVAAKERQERNLGLYIGEHLDAQDMGVLGYAVVHAGTVEHMINTYNRYFVVYGQGVDLQLNVSGTKAVLSYQLTDPSIVQRSQDAEMALAFLNKLIREGAGDEWYVREVHFEHVKPNDVSEHKKIFGAPILFDKPVNALIFDKKFLNYPIKEADTRLFPVLTSHLEAALVDRSEESDLVAQVSNIIAKSLSTQVPSLAEVADKLGTQTWTLQRRLRDKDIVYSKLVTDVRQHLAESYLQQTDMPLTEVAFLLGYSEISAFSRAFRRWSGKAPLEYRRAAQSTE